jgi:hypothetical protein
MCYKDFNFYLAIVVSMAWGFMRTFFPETKKRRKAAKTEKNKFNKEHAEAAKRIQNRILNAELNQLAAEEELHDLFKSQTPAKVNNKLLNAFAASNKVAANKAATNKNGNNEDNLTNNDIKAAAKRLENLFNKSGIPSKLSASRTRNRRRILAPNARNSLSLLAIPKPRSI